MADFQYSANLTVKQILDALNQVDKTNQKVWQRAEKDANRAIKGIIADHKRLQTLTSKLDKSLAGNAKGFGDIGKSAQASGVQIGVVSGIVTALTTEFINMGKQAVSALIGIAKEGTQVALDFDILRSRLLGIFDGSKPAAEEAFNFIQEKSKQLGINLGEVAGAFLPKVESLAQFERVAKIATALARSDPEQGAIGARIALLEALSGTFTSLQRRFEIPKDDIKAIKEAFDTDGMEGFITKLEEVLAKSGKSFDDLKNTAQASIDRVKIQFEQLKGALGVPIVEELKEQFDALFAVMEGREDDLLLIADTFGRVAANIVEIIGTGLTEFLTNLDTEQVIEIGETIFTITEDIKLLSELLLGVEFPASFIDGVEAAADKLHEVLETTAKIVALAQANAARAKAETQEAFNIQIETGIPFITSDEQRDRIRIAGEKAHQESLTASVGAMQDATQASEENAAATDKRREAIEKAKDTSTDDADALLGEARALEAAAEAAEASAAAQAKINEATAKIETDFQRDLLQADIKFERARTDTLLDGQHKREDAARKNLQKIADIETKNRQAIADSGLDLNRDIEDIATKHARETIEQRKDEAQKIIDLETDTRRKIADIIDKSQIDLDEAESKRDAVSFLRVLKQRNQEISAAQQDTSRAIQDTRIEGQRKRDELKLQQEQEIQDARLANERRLEDLKTSLDRELEAQAVAFAREREEIAINEQQKLDDLALARERDREDAARNRDEKLADLQVSMAEELAIIQAGNAAIEEEARRHAAELAAIEAQERAQSQANADDDTPDSRPGQQNRRRQRSGQPNSRPGFLNRFQHGGAFTVGGLGGADSQLVQFMATPGERVMISPRTPANNVNNFNNQRAISVNQNMLDPSQQSAIMRAIARQEALDLINGLD